MSGWWDFLFPKVCLGCNREVGEYVCSQCLNYLQPIKEPICPACNRNSLGGVVHPLCRAKSDLEGLVSIYPYKGLVKKIVTNFKYKFISDLLETITELIVSNADWREMERKNWLVVGVPLHPRRLRWRGFNQAESIGKTLAKDLGWVYVEKVVQRIKFTTPQMNLSGEERQTNLVGAFAGGEEIDRVNNQPVLLVDDVWTTGATMRECAKVLKREGKVREIWGLTFARSV
jgi:ComF family protein